MRLAINDAIDRSAMLKAVAKGYGTVTTQIFAKTSPAFDSSLDSQYPFDPAKAKQLLAAAGYPNGFTLNMPLIPIGSTTVFDLVKQYLGDVGIKVNYTSTSLNDIIDAVLAPKFPATYFTLQMDPTPWQEANFVIAPNATFNPFHTTSPQVNSLLHTIQVGSTSASDAAAKQLNTYMVQQAWVLTRGTASRASSLRTPAPPWCSRATTPTRTCGTSRRSPDPRTVVVSRPARRPTAHHQPAPLLVR